MPPASSSALPRRCSSAWRSPCSRPSWSAAPSCAWCWLARVRLIVPCSARASSVGERTMIDVLKYRYVYFLISALIILPGLVFIGLGGLKPGVDFTGGTELTVLMPKGVHPALSAVESVVRSVPCPGHPGYMDDSQVQQVQVQGQAHQQGYLIRTRDIGANVAVQKSLIAALKAKYGNVQ